MALPSPGSGRRVCAQGPLRVGAECQAQEQVLEPHDDDGGNGQGSHRRWTETCHKERQLTEEAIKSPTGQQLAGHLEKDLMQ